MQRERERERERAIPPPPPPPIQLSNEQPKCLHERFIPSSLCSDKFSLFNFFLPVFLVFFRLFLRVFLGFFRLSARDFHFPQKVKEEGASKRNSPKLIRKAFATWKEAARKTIRLITTDENRRT